MNSLNNTNNNNASSSSSSKKKKSKAKAAAGANTGNNNNNGGSATANAGTPKSKSSLSKIMGDRLKFLTQNLVGQIVRVETRDGNIHEGIWSASNPDGFGVVLRVARILSNNPNAVQRVDEERVIDGKDIVQIIAHHVTLSHEQDTGKFREESFHVDTDISGHRELRERHLVAWMPETDVDDGGLEDSVSSDALGWDQFAINQKLFGVSTTYQEELYTTKLDKNSEFYKQNHAKAAKIANEIMRKQTTNIHLAEERGQRIQYEDEEALYSSVIRTNTVPAAQQPSLTPTSASTSKQPQKYVPPQKRKAEPGEQPQAEQQPAQQKQQKQQRQDKEEKKQEDKTQEEKKQEDKKQEEKKQEDKKQQDKQQLSSLQTPQLQVQASEEEEDKAATGRAARSNSLTIPYMPLGGELDKKTHVDRVVEASRARRLSNPTPPMIRNGAGDPLVSERLKIRKAILNGKAPNSPTMSPRSPLSSPLVGDPLRLTALSLEPATPKIPEEVKREFMEFKLSQEDAKKEAQKLERQKEISALKNFSQEIKGKSPVSSLTNSPSHSIPSSPLLAPGVDIKPLAPAATAALSGSSGATIGTTIASPLSPKTKPPPAPTTASASGSKPKTPTHATILNTMASATPKQATPAATEKTEKKPAEQATPSKKTAEVTEKEKPPVTKPVETKKSEAAAQTTPATTTSPAKAPAEKAPAEKAPAEKAPAEKAPAGKAEAATPTPVPATAKPAEQKEAAPAAAPAKPATTTTTTTITPAAAPTTTAATTTTAAPTTTTSTTTTATTTTTTTTSATTTAKPEVKKKLNPNAKPFVPMTALAPATGTAAPFTAGAPQQMGAPGVKKDGKLMGPRPVQPAGPWPQGQRKGYEAPEEAPEFYAQYPNGIPRQGYAPYAFPVMYAGSPTQHQVPGIPAQPSPPLPPGGQPYNPNIIMQPYYAPQYVYPGGVMYPGAPPPATFIPRGQPPQQPGTPGSLPHSPNTPGAPNAGPPPQPGYPPRMGPHGAAPISPGAPGIPPEGYAPHYVAMAKPPHHGYPMMQYIGGEEGMPPPPPPSQHARPQHMQSPLPQSTSPAPHPHSPQPLPPQHMSHHHHHQQQQHHHHHQQQPQPQPQPQQQQQQQGGLSNMPTDPTASLYKKGGGAAAKPTTTTTAAAATTTTTTTSTTTTATTTTTNSTPTATSKQ